LKLSDYLMSRVAEAGVKHVFMLPGGGAMHLNDSLGGCEGLDFVCNLHEQAAALAAEAYARVTNNLGVAMVTSGPGGTNAVTGVAAAWLDSTPCLFISGQVKRADLKRDSGVRAMGVQEGDIVGVVGPITKYAITVEDPTTIRYHFERALYLARSGRPGPVWIDVPLDVQAAEIDPDRLAGFDPGETATFQGSDVGPSAEQAIELLNGAERPVILAGNGVRLAGATEAFEQLVDRLGVPVLLTWLGLDLLPDDHPLYIGRPGSLAPRGANFALQNSDCLLSIGARLDLALTAYSHERLARGAKKIMVDIDPAELRKMKTPIELPIEADAGAIIRALLERSDRFQTDRPKWRRRCSDWKTRYPLVQAAHREQPGPVSVYHFSEVLSEELAETDVIVPGSSGLAVELFLLTMTVKRGQRVFHNGCTGAMGIGLPAALGAAVASGRRTVSVDGDGGFQMNIQELATVAAHRLPIKFFVINNEGYASIRTSQSGYFGRLVGADSTSGLALPNLEKVAGAYGVTFRRIPDRDAMREGIRDVLNVPGPVVCEVISRPDEAREPRAVSRQRADGSMESAPLEDLFPFLDRDEFRENMLIPPLED
jgi:acetolactate synthase-1/2/3 large subunit